MSRGERIVGVPAAFEAIVADPEKYTLKRAAWAYGCAAKGSEIESKLLAILVGKVLDTGKAVDPSSSTRRLLSLPVPIGKPIIQERPKPNPSWWSNTSCSSRSSSEARCHPGDKCDNFPSCESCGPARQ